MTTMQRKRAPAATHVVHETEVVRHPAARKALAALRLAYGLVFLWAFFDKLLALGYATGRDAETGTVDRFGDAAWINGGSPTEGFLDYGVAETNWFQGFFNALGGTPFADWLFMVGLLGIGAALTFGFGMRIAAATGALLYTLMWIASFPLENNPIVDDHVLGAISVVVLGLTLAGDTWGVGKAWASRQLVRQYPFLR